MMSKCSCRVKFVCCFILYLFLCSPMLAERKHALIFGLGKQEDRNWSKINGDIDAAYVGRMLEGCGFKDIRILTNERATKQGMAQAFLDLIRVCKKGDIVYIHYSGHGQYMTDLDGDEAERWTGKHAQWDESWIPYDAYMYYSKEDRGEKHFCDDEIARFLSMIRSRIGSSGELYVVVDACHSGDATRGSDDESVRGVDKEFVIPRNLNTQQSRHVEEKWLTISACKPYQLCFEQKIPTAGKLTYALYKLGGRIFTMSNKQIQSALNKYMEEHPSRLPQNPVISGRR